MTEQKRKKAELVKLLIKSGWNPPTPTSHIVSRIADDMERLNTTEESRADHWKPTLGLTETQLQILTLVAEGHTQPEIAAMTDRKPDTVKQHMKAALVKLGATNAPHAVAIAIRDGLIDVSKSRSVGWEQAA